MTPELKAKIPQVREIWARHPVNRLSAFGSAVTGAFDPARSDIDVLLKLDALPALQYGEAYFAIFQELEDLLARPIDVVTDKCLVNPYIKKDVEATAVVVYDKP